jgi:polysaccharide export outer membrane protein
MKKKFVYAMLILCGCICSAGRAFCQQDAYMVGIDDLLEISVLSPEVLSVTSLVAPDGSISLPYIGNIVVKGLSLGQVQQLAEEKLSEGYMKYPVVSVALKDSRSKKFFVYGEVVKPGPYVLDDGTTVLRAISEAGGFTKFGSSSRVKILRPKENNSGYDVKKVNMAAVMSGNSNLDTGILAGDVIVVSEGIF